MKNSKLLSIGELSGLSKVHIKSLRYYDRIGVLPPAYVDPDSGYRYYSFNQLFLVDAIQLCIELDIPLKDFNRFISEDGKVIYYDRLFSHGKEIATEKIKQINQRLYMLEKAQEEIARSVSLEKGKDKPFFMEEQLCILVPFQGSQADSAFNAALRQVILGLNPDNVIPGSEAGLVRIFEKDSWSKYLYFTVDSKADCPVNGSKNFVFPRGTYMCRECSCDDIDKTELLPQPRGDRGLIIETELFCQSYDFTRPRYELRRFLYE